VVEPGLVQPFDAVGRQQIAVRDHPRDHASVSHVADDGVQIRMQ
jgi:hypothetical protein